MAFSVFFSLFQSDWFLFELQEYTGTSINSLLNTTQQLKEKKEMFYQWYLNEYGSLQYMASPEKIKNKKQIYKIDLQDYAINEDTDLSLLDGIRNVNLSRLAISDVSALGNAHILNLSYCLQITDIRALGNVHTLILYSCHNLTNVSALGKVHTLEISYCMNLPQGTNISKIVTTI